MEKIKVNMSPNPLDVQTIHASQNDGEARQWEFELHNNGELIDTSDVKEQLVFKAYKGGTEQLLPENGSTPTTSPFLGDIKYPQGLLTDQEFTYRQSPTEEDGLAKITDIKGNTLVWNQLISEQYSHTFTAGGSNQNVNIERIDNIVAGHKYLYAITQANSMTSNVRNTLQYLYSNGSNVTVNESNATNHNLNAGRYGWIFTAPSGNANNWISLYYWCHTPNVEVTIKDAILVDLTLMFGAGKEPVTAEEFLSLFNLPYYSYNAGSLLSFNGNGLKTVGFNQWDEDWEVGAITAQGTPSITADRIRSKNFIPAEPNTRYFRKTPNNIQPFFYDANQQFIEYGLWGMGNFITPSNCAYMKFQVDPVYGLSYKKDICINISNTELNGKYEPYKASSSSLPISQYFPNGMKSAGSAYDELSATKATVRIKKITVDGSEAWVKSTSYQGNYYVLGLLSDVKYPGPNAISNSLILVYNTTQLSANDLCFMFDGSAGSYNVNIKNTSMTTVDQFKAWLQANPVTIYYELKTPTETSFTTASLVTENGEVALANENGVLVGKCNSNVSADAGFIEGKIKLSDEDGDVYSNKIQIHVERSPQ